MALGILGGIENGVNTGFSTGRSAEGGDILGMAQNYIGGMLNAVKLGINTGFLDYQKDMSISKQMAQVEKQQMLPDNANLSGSATAFGYGFNSKGIFTHYCIKRSFAERLDKYFDMYGYLTNELKLPNLSNRPNWNYLKIIAVNIIGNIPQEDLEMIKNIFNNGVTLWHNPNTFLDYSQNNR